MYRKELRILYGGSYNNTRSAVVDELIPSMDPRVQLVGVVRGAMFTNFEQRFLGNRYLAGTCYTASTLINGSDPA